MTETSGNYDDWVKEELKKDKNAKKTDFYPDKDLATRKKEAETPPPKNEESDELTTRQKASKVAKAGADAAGQMAAAHSRSWQGLTGGTTEVSDSSKNFTMVRESSGDVLTAAERKRLEKMSSGYG